MLFRPLQIMRERIYRRLTSIIVRWWYIILITAGILTAFCYPYTTRLFGNISTDLIKLLPQHYKSVQTLEHIRSKFPNSTGLAIVLESPNADNTKKLLHFLVDKFTHDKAVKAVGYKKPGYSFFDKHKLLFLDLEDLTTIRDRIDRRIQKEKLGSFYIDFEEDEEDTEFKFGDIESKYKSRYTTGARSEYITDNDGLIYTMSLTPSNPDEGLSAHGKFYDYVTGEIGKVDLQSFGPDMRVYYAGTITGRLTEYKTLISDLKLAGIVSGLGIFLLLAIYYRRPLSVLLIFAPIGIGIIYSFAFAYIFIKNLNVVTSFLFAVLGGLGIEIGIHMFSRYIEERNSGKSVEEGIFIILYYTGRAAITSGLTLAATFLILMINDFKGFSEFGLITGSGILIVYLTYHIVLPPLIVAAEKIRLLKFKCRRSSESVVSDRAFPYSKAVLIATILLVALSSAGLALAKFEYNFGKLKANVKETQLAREKLRKTMPTVNRPAVVLIKDLNEALAVKEFVDKKIAEDETAKKTPVIDAFRSWYDVVQYNQDEKMAVIGEIKQLLSDKTLKLVKGEHKKDLDEFKDVLNTTIPIKPNEIPNEVKEVFFGTKDDGYQLAYINAEPHMELDDGRNAIAFAERIEKIETPGKTLYASSDALVFADVLTTMLGDVPRVVILSFLCVFGIVLIDLRNFRKAALIMSPILIGVVIMFGFMFITRMRLNFYNMIVIPTVFGTSIDNSIHIFHRFEEMGRGSLLKVLKTSGGAALMSSLTNIFGFLGLVFANHLGLASIGKLAIAGMCACLFTTLIYFPAMLQWLSDRDSK